MEIALSSVQEVFFYIIGILPLGYIFPYMWIFLISYCAYCIIPCLILKNRSSITIVGYLGGLIIASQISAVWNTPLHLMIVHALLLTGLIIIHTLYSSLGGKFADRFIQFATMLVVVSVLATELDAMPWIHQSVVNIIFFLMCRSAKKAGNNSLEMLNNIRKQSQNGSLDTEVLSVQYREKLDSTLLIPFIRPVITA